MVVDPADSGPTPRRHGWSAARRRQFALSFAAFLFLFGQPVVVFALALLTPTPRTLLVIAVGTVALAATAARSFTRQGRSIGRLADFLLVLAGTQVLLFVVATAMGPGGRLTPTARPVVVLLGYPVAYAVTYRDLPRVVRWSP
jgi:hypothetical protein